MAHYTPLMMPPERPGHPASPALAARRQAIAAAIAAGLLETAPPPTEHIIAGVRTVRHDPATPPRAALIHFHGGAYRIGCPEQVGRFAAALATRCNTTVYCPAYRLAPEHPFPAALRDGWGVLCALADPTRPLIVSGDSAGGGLALALAALAVGAGLPLAGLVLFSPWLDLAASAPSFARNAASDPLFSTDAAQEAAALYLQGHDSADPRASPIRASVEGLPPTLLSVGDGEVLVDDVRHLHERLGAAGVASILQVMPGMEHVAVTRDLALTGAQATFDAAAAFIEGLA